MKKRILVMLCMIAVLAILVGCAEKVEGPATTASQFVGGTTGLTIVFAEGTPPEEIMDQDQQFGISVRVTNRGDHTIDNTADATVTITGIDPADFGSTSSELTQDSPEVLLGARKDAQGTVVAGTDLVLDFPKSGGSLTHQKPIAGSVDYNLRAELCYKYQSSANTKLCILSDLLSTKADTLCTVNEVKPVDNSGAPVHVESFRESVSSSNKVAFVFKIKHMDGIGKVFEQSSECEDVYAKRDQIHVTVDTGISDGLTCSGLQNGAASGTTYTGDALLLNGEREIRCTQTINNPSDLEKLVTITLGYDYKTFAEKKLTVKHIGP